MIKYRSFRNTDPPKLVDLWHFSRLGRGAAGGIRYDALEQANFSQSYFDPKGLIVACDGLAVVGMAHAGFGCTADESALSRDRGVISAVMVDPDYRLRGIGRQLVERAESYLTEAGSTEIFAGQTTHLDPFYWGLYGGAEPTGFLESSKETAPFFKALGYEPIEHIGVYQRNLVGQSDPVNYRLSQCLRATELVLSDRPESASWWWMTRLAKLDTLRFVLRSKRTGQPVAGLTVVGLELYLSRWQERAVGLTDICVVESERRKGYGHALLVEVMRRLRQELITRVEVHVSENNAAGMALMESCDFERVDRGTVFRRKSIP